MSNQFKDRDIHELCDMYKLMKYNQSADLPRLCEEINRQISLLPNRGRVAFNDIPHSERDMTIHYQVLIHTILTENGYESHNSGQ